MGVYYGSVALRNAGGHVMRRAAAVMLAGVATFCGGAADVELYGGLPPERYLTGRFIPSRHERFVCLNDMGIPTSPGRHYLRREAAEALAALYRAFRRDHPDAPFWVQSSTRTFGDQKYLWEAKWTGRVPVQGISLAQVKDPLVRARAILSYSSMPGTSRHHWGTDVDFNVLTNAYYESGPGRILYRWLLANAPRFGFCRPYTAGRSGGYREEKWHWSYLPLARRFLAEWNGLYRRDHAAFSAEGLFPGSKQAGILAPEYVNTIAEECR